MQFAVLNKFSGKFQFIAEIEHALGDEAPIQIKMGLAVQWAITNSADLSDAVLRGAVLRDAVLRGAPKIENIHRAVYEAASKEGALNMSDWHTCETTHCRAGWVVHLAGAEGRALEKKMGTPAAATLIYLASDPTLERVPDFYCGNAAALDDMRRLAEKEAA